MKPSWSSRPVVPGFYSVINCCRMQRGAVLWGRVMAQCECGGWGPSLWQGPCIWGARSPEQVTASGAAADNPLQQCPHILFTAPSRTEAFLLSAISHQVCKSLLLSVSHLLSFTVFTVSCFSSPCFWIVVYLCPLVLRFISLSWQVCQSVVIIHIGVALG